MQAQAASIFKVTMAWLRPKNEQNNNKELPLNLSHCLLVTVVGSRGNAK